MLRERQRDSKYFGVLRPVNLYSYIRERKREHGTHGTGKVYSIRP